MSIGRSLPWTRTRGELLVVRCRSLPPISIIFFSSSLNVMPAITRLSSQHGFPQNFLERGQPGGSLDQAAAAQRDHSLVERLLFQFHRGSPDRKSTRLNSSHRCISYAVFCLKKTRTDELTTYQH